MGENLNREFNNFKKIIIIKPCNPPLTRVNETRRQVESSSAREVLSRITAILTLEGFLF